ncbi:MAG: sugar transferase [Saprospiraceae bacterium]|nr:sugar transferase [Saprospiraceae bacterium]
MLLLIPLTAPIILLLACTGERKVFYRQMRIGFKKRQFGILKFATMLQNSPNLGAGSLTLKNDPRVTPVGKYLRKSKINELPQLINVIAGDMSLVGPRPQMLVDFEAYSPEVQERIYEVKPGITGIGSIVFRDEEKLLSAPGRNARQFYLEHIAPYKGALEMWYQAHCSFSTDIKLIFLTVWVIFFPTSTLYFRIFKDLPKMPIAIQTT